MRSDLYPSTVYGNWHVVTVLEEMESEGIVVQHTINHNKQVISKCFQIGYGNFASLLIKHNTCQMKDDPCSCMCMQLRKEGLNL